MALRDLIKSLGLSGTAAEITAALNAKTETKTNVGKVTWATMADLFDAATVARWDGTLKALGLEWVRSTLSGAGLDFSNPKSQAMLDQLVAGGAIPVEEGVQLKAVGIQQVSPYENWAGVGQVVSEADVVAALIPPVVDGRAISVAVSVTPQGDSVALSITTMVGQERMDIVHSLATSKVNDPTLTEAQRAFVKGLVELVKSYVF